MEMKESAKKSEGKKKKSFQIGTVLCSTDKFVVKYLMDETLVTVANDAVLTQLLVCNAVIFFNKRDINN